MSHPLASQLFKKFQKYFVAFNLQKECSRLNDSCSFCLSLARFPKELEEYNPQLVPTHPGSHMNMDIMRRAGQIIMVNCDLFSGYTTACITNSEQREDMVQGTGGTKVPNARADGSGINSEYCTHWEDIQKLMLGKAIKV